MEDDGGDKASENAPSGTVYVAEKKGVNLAMAFLLIIAGMFLLIGISSLASILGIFQSYIMDFLAMLTGWDPILSSLFIGIMALFVATLLYVIARRGSEVAQKIEAALRMNVTNEATEYYALETIPDEELLNEFKKRGCAIKPSGKKGYSIDCPEADLTRRVLGVIEPNPYTLSKMQKYAVAIVATVVWSIYIGTLIFEVVTGDGVWIAAIALLSLTAILLLGTHIIRLWHTIILWTGVNIAFSLLFAIEPTIVWSMWGVEAIYVVLVAIAYILYRGQCELDDNWYCDLM